MMQMWTEPTLRRIAGVAWCFLGILFLLSSVIVQDEVEYFSGELQAQPEATLPIERLIQTQNAKDKGRAVRLLMPDGSISELSMEEYLWCVVAAEMPASFEPEALKAQTCAARTYTVRQQEFGSKKHDGADICADSHCCQAYISRSDAERRWGFYAQTYGNKIEEAVSSTDGLGIVYDGTPIQALFFSSAPGKTTDAVEVWGNQVEYLQSVNSPEGDEVPNYHSQVVLTVEEVRVAIQNSYPTAVLSGNPEEWFTEIFCGESGAVSSLVVGGITLTGTQMRTLFGLRSAAFTITYDGTNFTFDVTGYGHGVGMSQYGANKMAQEGASYQTILTWYYTGAEVATLW